jgi:NAD(P)-dependent dehydrogenase (short-subunit alcohol dehydrogenase family)
VADARNSKDVRRALAEIDDRMGGLDGLVNAAGVLNTTRVDDLDDATWDAVLESNLTATFLVCREALPYLRRSPNAAIANVAALAAVLPGVASVAYSAAKAGVIQLSKVLAAQLAPGIRVNSVCPGAVDTAMTRGFLDDKSPEQREAFIARYASKRLATPDELANLLCFLISNEASCITGSNFVADGGRAYR